MYLKDVWPTNIEVQDVMTSFIDREMFATRYANVFEGDRKWRGIAIEGGDTYSWNPCSHLRRQPALFRGHDDDARRRSRDIRDARPLAIFADSITTDHISPAGIDQGGQPRRPSTCRSIRSSKADFNSYGARRGNHEVMMRGTFANIRIKNEMIPGIEGGMTKYIPSGEVMAIYDAAMRYKADGTPLVVIAGKEYGTGSSRDWAAKGTNLLGVRAVIAESFERIHRSNLVGMGVVPLQFADGVDRKTLKLDGTETFTIENVAGLRPRQEVTVT